MRFLSVIVIFLASVSAYSYEVSVSCSTASYACSGSLCGWWVDAVPIGQLPKKITLTQDPEDALVWKAETTEIIKDFSVTSRFYTTVENENKITFHNWVELSKDGVIAEAPGYTSPYGDHLSIRLRSGKASLEYTCMVKFVK